MAMELGPTRAQLSARGGLHRPRGHPAGHRRQTSTASFAGAVRPKADPGVDSDPHADTVSTMETATSTAEPLRQ